MVSCGSEIPSDPSQYSSQYVVRALENPWLLYCLAVGGSKILINPSAVQVDCEIEIVCVRVRKMATDHSVILHATVVHVE